jgi:hypothetical protein
MKRPMVFLSKEAMDVHGLKVNIQIESLGHLGSWSHGLLVTWVLGLMVTWALGHLACLHDISNHREAT